MESLVNIGIILAYIMIAFGAITAIVFGVKKLTSKQENTKKTLYIIGGLGGGLCVGGWVGGIPSREFIFGWIARIWPTQPGGDTAATRRHMLEAKTTVFRLFLMQNWLNIRATMGATPPLGPLETAKTPSGQGLIGEDSDELVRT